MKLFKKVAAAILAGVMALSMVACAPANVDPINPDDIVIPPTSSAADEIIAYMNVTRKQAGVAEIENDERLAKIAEIYLTVLTSENADWNSNPNTVSFGNADAQKALKKALNAEQLEQVGVHGIGAKYATLADATANLAGFAANKSALKYEVTDELKVRLTMFGFNLGLDGATESVGVATVTAANGDTFALIIVQ